MGEILSPFTWSAVSDVLLFMLENPQQRNITSCSGVDSAFCMVLEVYALRMTYSLSAPRSKVCNGMQTRSPHIPWCLLFGRDELRAFRYPPSLLQKLGF